MNVKLGDSSVISYMTSTALSKLSLPVYKTKMAGAKPVINNSSVTICASEEFNIFFNSIFKFDWVPLKINIQFLYNLIIFCTFTLIENSLFANAYASLAFVFAQTGLLCTSNIFSANKL